MMSKVKHDESLIESGQNTIAAVIPNIIHTILLITLTLQEVVITMFVGNTILKKRQRATI